MGRGEGGRGKGEGRPSQEDKGTTGRPLAKSSVLQFCIGGGGGEQIWKHHNPE